MKEIKAIDVHSHLSTRKGFLLRTQEEIEFAQKYYRWQMEFKTEQQMAEYFREARVRSILDGRFGQTLEEAMDNHNYLFEVVRSYHDVFLGAWAYVKPQFGKEGVQELERCLKDLNMFGLFVHNIEAGVRSNDRSYYPLYELCAEFKAPVLITVGMSGQAAGRPGGGGYHLKYTNPMDLDDIAADFPQLLVIAAHPAWPWQDEMIAILLHKSNVFNDLHGWSPKYFPPELKREINGRLQDRFLFGADYPSFAFERLFRDWESEGYKQEVLEKVYYKNAVRIFGAKLQLKDDQNLRALE